MSGQDYNSQLMSSLHKQGGKGSVNTTLFGGRDGEALKRIFADPTEALNAMHANLDVKNVLGGEKGFSLGGQGSQAVFHTGDPKAFDQGQKTFSQAGQQSSFSLAGAGTMLSTGNFQMNPMESQRGMGLGFAQMMMMRPNTGIQGAFLGYSGFNGVGTSGQMMQGTINFPSFGLSNAAFSTGGSGGGGGGGSSAAMAGGGGSSFSRGLPSFSGVTFGGNVSQAALGQMSARSAAPMNMSLGGGADISLG